MFLFIIPIAGLALGVLGRLISRRRSLRALGEAGIKAEASTPSETGLSTAASGSTAPSNLERQGYQENAGDEASQKPPTRLESQGYQEGAGDEASRKPGPLIRPVQPATGPVQQNQGTNSPTAAPGADAGLGARLGRESAARARKRNKEQEASVSKAALS